MQTKRENHWTMQQDVWVPSFCWSNRKTTRMGQTSRKHFSVVLRHGRTCSKCVERYCELANKKTEQLFKVSNPCLDDHQIKKEELEHRGEMSEVCSHIVLKCLYLARIDRADILWSVNNLARSVTRWTQACDRRLARWISYFHCTSDYRQYCHVGNAAQHCRLGLFQDSEFAGDLEDSKSTSGGVLCSFGSRTLKPISWMCKKQTSVSHQLHRIWDHLAGCWFAYGCEVLRTTHGIPIPTQASTRETGAAPPKAHPRVNKCWTRMWIYRTWIKFFRTHISLWRNHSCTFSKTTNLWKDDQKRQKPDHETHVPHPPSCPGPFIWQKNLDAKIQINYVESKNQLADIFTKGSFTRDEWHNLLHLFLTSWTTPHFPAALFQQPSFSFLWNVEKISGKLFTWFSSGESKSMLSRLATRRICGTKHLK